MTTRPNVLLLVIDSLRADALTDPAVPTPVLDAVRARGAHFEQCISTSTMTTPSFAALLTGCYPMKHGVRGLRGYHLSDEVTTLAEQLGAAGYHTVAEVTGPLLPETSVTRGFAESRHRVPGKFMEWRDEIGSRIDGLREPWFVLLHVWEVHNPFRHPPDFKKRWDRKAYTRVVSAVDAELGPLIDRDDRVVVVTGDHGEQFPSSLVERGVTWAVRKLHPRLKLADRAPTLDRWMAARTLGHGHDVYDHLVRVPLVVAGPGIERATVPDQVRHVDVAPTIAALCAAPPLRNADGRDVAPLWRGGALEDAPAYIEAGEVAFTGANPIIGLRTPDWKLVKDRGRTSLFSMKGVPPDERRDLSAAHPDVADRLDATLEALTATRVTGSGMTEDEEAIVERHLQDLGYL